MVIGAAVFDLFATLVSPDAKGFPGAVRGTWEALGISKAEWRSQTFEETSRRLTGEVKDPFEIVRTMAHAIDPRIPESRIRQATLERQDRFRALLTHVPNETVETLQELRVRGVAIGLITNADVIETNAWDLSPLARLVDVPVFSWRIGCAKPDLAIYEHTLTRLNKRPEQALFVGDGGSHELEGAKAAGMTAVFARQYLPISDAEEIAHREATADASIDCLSDLLTLVGER